MDASTSQTPFAKAAAYYDRFRPGYAPGAIDFIIDRFGLGPGVRVLDLGCGPGTLAIPLSRSGAEVTAVDIDPGMLDEARRLAAERRAGSIDCIQGRAEDVLPGLGTFRLVVFGQSLHWMDRDRVLRDIAGVIEDGGGLAIVDARDDESWGPVAWPVLTRYFDQLDRHPMKHPESAHEPSLLRSRHFARFDVEAFSAAYVREATTILGFLYSCVGVSRAALGDRAEAFEAEVAGALAQANPIGRFQETTTTQVFVAMKAAAD